MYNWKMGSSSSIPKISVPLEDFKDNKIQYPEISSSQVHEAVEVLLSSKSLDEKRCPRDEVHHFQSLWWKSISVGFDLSPDQIQEVIHKSWLKIIRTNVVQEDGQLVGGISILFQQFVARLSGKNENGQFDVWLQMMFAPSTSHGSNRAISVMMHMVRFIIKTDPEVRFRTHRFKIFPYLLTISTFA
jgi:hypothetical protein